MGMENKMEDTPKVLTKEMVVKMMTVHEDEWKKSGDWWWGTENAFKDLPFGVDANVYMPEDEGDQWVVVYELGAPDEGGFSWMTNNEVMKFNLTEYLKEARKR